MQSYYFFLAAVEWYLVMILGYVVIVSCNAELICCREIYSTIFCYAMILVKLVCFIPTMTLDGVVVEQHQVNLWQ
jgi:hypothetical protein